MYVLHDSPDLSFAYEEGDHLWARINKQTKTKTKKEYAHVIRTYICAAVVGVDFGDEKVE